MEASKAFFVSIINDAVKQETNYDECCICKEVTSGKTPCNHSLCYACWSNIQETKSSKCFCDNNCGNKLCPLCRKLLEGFEEKCEEE